MTRSGRRRGRNEEPGPAGFVVVDKPPGITSHDVVDAVRRWLGTRQIGHLGTLDPAATGVLPLAVREATKLVPFVEGGAKSYVGAIRLGIETNTLDADGEVLRRWDGALPEEADVLRAMQGFVGEIDQVPPMFSAVKRDGVPLHKLAREGVEIEREPKRVRIDRFERVKYVPPLLEIEVDCSAGTYVRALAADLGRALGCGAHLASLRRTRSGPFRIEQARPLAELCELPPDAPGALIPPAEVLGLPIVELTALDARRLLNGGEVDAGRRSERVGDKLAALDPQRQLIAVVELAPGRRLRPLRVLRSAGQAPQ
jgi:tRNA pseudouridine55 synthase